MKSLIMLALFRFYAVDPRLCCDCDTFAFFERLTFEQLVSHSAHDVPYDCQVFVVLKQLYHNAGTKSNAFHPDKVVEVIGIMRNRRANAYSVSQLDTSRHFSASLVQFYFLCKRLVEVQEKSYALITFVPSTHPKYVSRDSRTLVYNHVDGVVQLDLDDVVSQFESSVRQGILTTLRCNEGSRSGKVSDSKAPVFHTGFTMSNCNEYNQCRATSLGHTRPSLITSYLKETSTKCKQEYGKAIAMLNWLMRDSPDSFKAETPKANATSHSDELRKEYYKYFEMDKLTSSSGPYAEYLRNTATTGLLNNHIDCHVDSLNDPTEGNSAVLCLSLCLPRQTVDHYLSPNVKSWLDKCSYLDYIPFCNLSYSRIVCRDYLTRHKEQMSMLAQCGDETRYLRRAIYDAVCDTDSDTNYASTFEKMKGLQTMDVTQCIDEFSDSQKVLHAKLASGFYKDVYKQCLESMGEGVIRNVKQVIGQMQEMGQTSNYSWYLDCKRHYGTRNAVQLCMDPMNTYQGPIISLRASYDVNRYISAIVDAYRDISTNMGPMTPKNGLAFSIFACVQSNSAQPVAELVRLLSKDNWSIKTHFRGNKYKGCLWSLIIDVCDTTKFKQIGSSRSPRYQISSGGEVFRFKRYSDTILKMFLTFKAGESDEKLFEKFLGSMRFLKNSIRNIGHVTALKLMQLSAIIGLLPLKVSTFACVEGGAPSKILRAVAPTSDPNTTFQNIYSDFRTMLGEKFTMSYLENMLCELQRELQATLQKKNYIPDDVKCLMTERGTSRKKGSNKEDNIFFYSHRGLEKCIGNLYRIIDKTDGVCELEVQSFEIDGNTHEVHKRKKLTVTSITDRALDDLYLY